MIHTGYDGFNSMVPSAATAFDRMRAGIGGIVIDAGVFGDSQGEQNS